MAAGDAGHGLTPAQRDWADDIQRRNHDAIGYAPGGRGRNVPSGFREAQIVDGGAILPRRWLYGRLLVRGYVSLMAAPGGVGKSTWTVTLACAVAAGKPLLGDDVPHRASVLICSLEDPADDLDRLLAAAVMHHGLDPAELRGRVFTRIGREAPLNMAALHTGGEVVAPDREELVRFIKEHDIGVVIVDPWVASHSIDESSNPQVAAAMRVWADIAEACGCAVLLVHHTRKSRGERGQADAARGAGALVNAARVALTLWPMEAEEAEDMGVPQEAVKSHIRLDAAKINLAAARDAAWFRLVSVRLGNGTPEYPDGDEVQAIERWRPPSIWDGISTVDINAALDRIARGTENGKRYAATRKGKATDRWAGRVLMDDLGVSEGAAAAMISAWLGSGLLRRTDAWDAAKCRNVPGIEVDDAKRPGR